MALACYSERVWIAISPVVALVVTASLVSPQRLVIQNREPLPDKRPVASPVERRKLAVDPETLFSKLVSKQPRQIRESAEALGLSWLADLEPTEVKLFAVNLDSDQDLERVLAVTGSLRTSALILKKGLVGEI